MFQAMLDSFIEIIVCTRDITREEFFIHLSHTLICILWQKLTSEMTQFLQANHNIKLSEPLT